MDALNLLQEARDAGLTVSADGDRLVIRGPRHADAIARRLLDHKDEVLDALAAPACDRCGAPLESAERLWLDGNALRAAWRRTVWELGEAAGWPRVPLPPPRSVPSGELAWRRFMSRAALHDLQRAALALREQLAAMPAPDEEPAT